MIRWHTLASDLLLILPGNKGGYDLSFMFHYGALLFTTATTFD